MVVKIKALIFPVLILYLILWAKLSFAAANIFLVLVLGGISFKIFSKKAKQECHFFNGIKSVPKELVFSDNTLSNNHCIVRYFPDKKIVVIDNPVSKEHEFLRAFVVDETNHENISDCWREVCSVFDGYTYLESLFSFIDKSSGRLSIMFLTSDKDRFTVEGMEDLIPEIQKKGPPVHKPRNDELAKKMAQPDDKGQIVVDFEDLKQRKIQVCQKENDEDIVNMQDLTDSDKINVNFADVQTISELPGINIVMAKKLLNTEISMAFSKVKMNFLIRQV